MISDFIYFWITKRLVSSDSMVAILAVSIAGGAGCALVCLFNDKLFRDRTYVNKIMSDDLVAMRNFRDFLARHHITNVAANSYTLKWNRKTITVTAYVETKVENRLINAYLADSVLKFKRVIQKG